MHRRLAYPVIILVLLIGSVAAKEDFLLPKLREDGAKFRIAYIQGGSFFEYDEVFAALIKKLTALKWANPIDVPTEHTKTAKAYFNYLAANKNWSDYLEFPEDAFFDSDWKVEARKKNQQKVLKLKNIDMIFAFGTWAGQDMKTMPAEFNVPVVVIDVSDALRANIVDSIQDSGRDNLTARLDPTRYQRQIRLFHDVVGFRNLGTIYEDTVEGRSYAAIDDVELVAKQRGFNLIRIRHPGYFKSEDFATQWTIKNAVNLSPKIDAYYFTQQLGINDTSMKAMLEVFNKNRIATFSQTGTVDVAKGVLLSIATSNYKHEAEFHANKIAQILHGAKPRDLPLVFEDPEKIAINLKTARVLGFDPPFDILEAADEVIKE